MVFKRHHDHTEIQPVPWIPEESKAVYTETSCNDFHKGFKRINASECILSGSYNKGQSPPGVQQPGLLGCPHR